MNMVTPENFTNLKTDATATENPALKRMMMQWEKKAAKNVARAGGVGMMAVSLSACGGSDDAGDGDSTPVTEGGVWSLVAGGLKLAGDFDPAIFAGGPLPANVLIGDPSVLTPGATHNVQGSGSPAGGDDMILTSSASILGAQIDLAGGQDSIFIDVTGSTVTGLVTNVENIEIANMATNTIPGTPAVPPVPGVPGTPGVPPVPAVPAASVINLSNVVDIEKLTISEMTSATDALQVTGIRNTAAIELQGNFNQVTNIDFLNATGPLDLTLNDYFQNAGTMNIAQDFSAIDITSAGEGQLNAIDAGTLGRNLQSLKIEGAVDFEVTGAIAFRGRTEATIDASGFAGDNLTLTVAGHRDVAFTGSAANDALSVRTANDPAGVNPDGLVELNADFGAGNNTLMVNNGTGGVDFVTPDSSIVSAGDLTLVIGGGTIDMAQPDAEGNALDLSAASKIVIGQGAALNLTAGQVEQVGIENFETPDFGNATGSLNITATADEALDLSDIDVGMVVNVTVGPGDVTLNAATVLGNANAGVQAIIVDNRGTDSSVTMTADQFQQLAGPGTVFSQSDFFGLTGTNNPATGEPYETTLVLTDLDADTDYMLNFVNTTNTDIQLTDFTADDDFNITGANNTDLTLTLAGNVDLTDGANVLATANNITFADGATLMQDGDVNIGTNPAFGDVSFEGSATFNLTGNNNTFSIDSDDVAGDASQVVVNFAGTGTGMVNVSGSEDITLEAVNSGDDITVVTVNNNLTGAATLEITGGSPALALGEDTTMLTVNGAADTITLIGTDEAQPDISSSTLTTINANAGADAVINLGELSVTSDDLTVNGNNTPGSDSLVSVEIGDVPAGAAWVFNGVEVVISADATFGAGATIELGPNVTLSGDFDIASLPLTSDSIVPLNADLSAAQIDSLLQSLEANQATVDTTGMSPAQLQAIVDNSLKVNTINGDLALTNDLTPFAINTLDGLYSQGIDDVLNINAASMSTAQKAAAGGAAAGNNTKVVNLTLTDDDGAGTIANLLAGSANNATTVNATDMSAAQLNALVADIANVKVINGMELTAGNAGTDITALLSKAAPQSVTVDAAGMGNAQFAAIEEQITKIDVIENLTVNNGSPAEGFQFSALLELATDANVDATGMSDARLSIVADNIANIEDDGITNLTITGAQDAAEITALMGKAPDGSVVVDLSGMSTDQVAAVVADADAVANLSVGENSSVSLTLAELTSFEAEGLTPIIGEAASDDAQTGGSITIVAASTGTLDLSLVSAGAQSATDNNGGTLTLDVAAGASLSVEGNTGSENLAVTGAGTLVVTENLDLSGLVLSVDAGITIELAAANPGISLTLTADQASDLAMDGVTVNKAAAVLPAVEAQIVANGGASGNADPQDLSALNLSLVDVLVTEDGNGTILTGTAADLPANVSGSGVLVTADTDWSGSSVEFNTGVTIAADATVTLSAATADESTGNFAGNPATAAGEAGGSIEIVGLMNGVEYDFTNGSAFTPGAAGPGDAGTFVVSIASDVTLEEATVLPSSAQVVIEAGSTLTVDADTAAQVNGTNDYEGLGTLNFIDADSTTVTADGEVRFNTFVIDDTESAVVINGFEAINIGGFNGQFLFDTSTNPDTLGTMSLNLSDFSTNGSGFVSSADSGAGLTGLADVSNAGVIVIRDGSDPTGVDLSGVTGASGSELFFAYENGTDVEVQYWDDAGGNSNGIVDAGELSLIATLDTTGTDQLGSENFVI